MTRFRLVVRSLRFHAKSNLGAFVGAAISAAILVGALTVGDSVRETLRYMALVRLGKTESAIASGDRFFLDDLPKRLDGAGQFAAAIQVPATVATSDGTARANKVQLLGVDGEFWKFASEPTAAADLSADQILLSQALAEHLHAKQGDDILLRVEKPSALSRDAPLSPEENSSVALRFKVRDVVKDAQFGRFSLQASQVPPLNAFVSRTLLQQKLALTNRVNLLLASGGNSNALATGLSKAWKLEDAELQLIKLTNSPLVELRTSRVFLDDSITSKISGDPLRILTYFVNELRVGDRTTPYSMVTAAGEGLLPQPLATNEIAINQWLADDLQAKAGDSLQLKYYVIGSMRELVQQSATFVVKTIVPMDSPASDRALMPDFPGMSTAENCRDWDTGFPIDNDKIRPKDEAYWKQYRGTPKAFVNLATGQKLWANRFGSLTAIRFSEDLETVRGELGNAIQPASVGLSFQPVREQAVAASKQGQDFGGLFIGFSLFIITSALLLMALLFQFGIEQRHVEVGTLLALGFTPRGVRTLLLLEGLLLAAVAAIPGTIAGLGYAKLMIAALTTIWKSAINSSALQFVVLPQTVIIGAVSGLLVAVLSMWLTLRKQGRQSAVILLNENSELMPSKAKHRPIALWIGVLAGMIALATTGWAATQARPDPEMFFSGGALLLISAIAFSSWFIRRLGNSASASAVTIRGLGLRGISRSPKRSRSVIALLACGSFLIASIGVFRLETDFDPANHRSGTGGFAFWAESAIPIVQDLNSAKGRATYNLDSALLTNVAVVPLRLREGEDASCLNLNRAQKPQILGVDPALMKGRFAFQGKGDWDQPMTELAADEVPAIGDAASIQWALGKKVGDVIPYTDGRGQSFKLRIVGALNNSMLQGSLLISEREFTRRFPSESGYRIFLIDAPSKQATNVAAHLTRALQDFGFDVTDANKRLAAFNAVQNTYLSTFQVLGGLGLLLGTAGLGVVVLRNVYERRGEMGVMLALGFTRGMLRKLVLSEHLALLWMGLGAGLAGAVIAVLPNVLQASQKLPWSSLGLTISAVFVTALICTWIATQWALRGKLIDALRNL